MAETGLRERSKARRRLAIIPAAYELFAERGYDATTVADIGEAAEVSPRTAAYRADGGRGAGGRGDDRGRHRQRP